MGCIFRLVVFAFCLFFYFRGNLVEICINVILKLPHSLENYFYYNINTSIALQTHVNII